MSKPSEAVAAALREYNEQSGDGLFDHEMEELAEVCADAAIDALFPRDVVVACKRWKTNADLIFDAWRLGYVKGKVLDLTAGAKGMWSRRLIPPPNFQALEGIEAVYNIFANWDFRNTPCEDGEWDTIFYDPPYKLNGDPNGLAELSERYGVDVPAKVQDRHLLMGEGLCEAIRITKPGGFILAKCQDQVANGEIHWQTDMMRYWAEGWVGFLNNRGRAKQVERFDMLGHHIPQPMEPSKRYPKGREQKHAHARPSTLLVFQKGMN